MPASEQPSQHTAILLVGGHGLEHQQRVELDGHPLRVGRASASELSFPENGELSREHFLIGNADSRWFLQDLNSRNGTMVNGVRVHGKTVLAHGDVIVAGHLSFRFLAEPPSASRPLLIRTDPSSAETSAHTRSTDLNSALASESSAESAGAARAHLRAFVRAGRELVSQRPMDELFGVILDIAVEAAGASRGVVAVRDGKSLAIRAQHGTDFHLSTGIVDQVLAHKKSLLIVDVAGESQLANRNSIVAGRVKSVIAVPLQTEDNVIGLLYVDTPSRVFSFTAEDLNLLTVLANVAAVRIEHARLIEIEQQEKIWARDREQAAEIQRSLLPFNAPSIPGFAIAGYNVASRAVGGDYYDFLPLEDGRLVFLVADVAGKGMPAALLMSGLQARVNVLFETGGRLAELVATLNRSLARRFPSNRFVTFCVATLTPASGEIAYCNAGHNPPLLLRAGGSHEYLDPTGPIIGISAEFSYADMTCRMLPGDILALYSDGVTEACDPIKGEEFGEERLLMALRSNSHATPASIIGAIVGEIAAFTRNSPLSDDVTLVILKRS